MGDHLKFVLVERRDDIATIWLNHPARMNVLSRRMMDELTATFAEVGSSDVTGVILAAKGKIFSAGHDFAEMAGEDLAGSRALFATCTSMMNALQSMPQPVVARVHGLATGAGCQLVATADLAVAAEEASFATPGGKGGLFCTTPLVAVGRLIGRRRALEMGMRGDAIDAATAASWGLVNQVVPTGTLDEATYELVRRVTRGSTESKAIGKAAFYTQIDLEQSKAYAFASEVMAAAALTVDAQEGIVAFIEKRAPRWRNQTAPASVSPAKR